MPRGLKTKLKTNILPKVEKGIAPMVKRPVSKAFSNIEKPASTAKMVKTIMPKKTPKSIKFKFD